MKSLTSWLFVVLVIWTGFMFNHMIHENRKLIEALNNQTKARFCKSDGDELSRRITTLESQVAELRTHL